MGFDLGSIGKMAGGVIGGMFGGPVGAALGSKAGEALGGVATDVIKGLPKPQELIGSLLGALGGGGGNQTNITNNFNLNNFMAQQKQCMRPMDYCQLENAVNELKGQVKEMFDFAEEMESKGVKCPNAISGDNGDCGKAGSGGGKDWFMAIASALADVIQNQANAVRDQADKVSSLSKKAAEESEAEKQTSAGEAKGVSSTRAGSAEEGKAESNTPAPKAEDELQREQTMLKAESQKLEFLTSAINTTLDKISGSLNQLGRAG